MKNIPHKSQFQINWDVVHFCRYFKTLLIKFCITLYFLFVFLSFILESANKAPKNFDSRDNFLYYFAFLSFTRPSKFFHLHFVNQTHWTFSAVKAALKSDLRFQHQIICNFHFCYCKNYICLALKFRDVFRKKTSVFYKSKI